MEKRELKNSLNKKKKVMEDFNNSPLSNFIIEAVKKEYHNTCAYVFKRGKNKGKSCLCKKKFNNSSYCKTHFNYLKL